MAKKEHNIDPETRAVVEILGHYVHAGRINKGWSQTRLAALLGTSRATVKAIETGSPRVSIGLFFQAADLCGIQLLSLPKERRGFVLNGARREVDLLPARPPLMEKIDNDF